MDLKHSKRQAIQHKENKYDDYLKDKAIQDMGRPWDGVPCGGATLDHIDDDAIRCFLKRSVEAGRIPEEAINDFEGDSSLQPEPDYS